MKTKRQIKNFILKTLLPYKQNKDLCGFSSEGYCVYLNDNGQKCAVGRWLKKGKWQTEETDVETLFRRHDSDAILLKPAYDMGFTVSQWGSMQRYHDEIASSSSKNIINFAVNILERKFNIELNELRIS